MANISPTIKINISTNSEIIEEFMLGASCSPEEIDAYTTLFHKFSDIFTWSYTEIPTLDPFIMEYHNDTWTDVAPICQKQRPIHPSKVAAVKAEIEKLRTTSFIYCIAYTTWVYNPIPMNKKQGTIHVFIDFHDLNGACPKDNFPTPSIDQVIDACTGHEAFSFMNSFFGYNQIQI